MGSFPFYRINSGIQKLLLGLLGLVFTPQLLLSQTDDLRLVGSKEGTLVINYWSSAPDPEVERFRSLVVEAIEIYLNGAVQVVNGEVSWKGGIRSIKKDLDRIVSDMMVLRKFKEKVPFEGFSDEIDNLLQDVEELDTRDVLRMKNSLDIPVENRFYFLIQSRLQEISLQSGIELGLYVNQGLFALIGQTYEPISTNSFKDWQTFDPNSPLSPIEVDFSVETMDLIDGIDNSSLPVIASNNDFSTSAIELSLLERIIELLEDNTRRLDNIERGNTVNLARSNWVGNNRSSPSKDPQLRALNLPDNFDVKFYIGSSSLTLNTQLQLNEVIELMVRYPQLRLMCTGHADISGERSANLNLSRSRANTVRNYILESGVNSERVIMNFFGEERAENIGAGDRRVIVTFFVD